MSDPHAPCGNHLKRKFEELPDQVTITDRPLNKHCGGLRLEFVLPDKYQPESADGTSVNIPHSGSALPTLITPSSTIHVADIAMQVTSKILFNLSAPMFTHQIKFAGDQVEVTGQGVVEHSQQVLCITGLH